MWPRSRARQTVPNAHQILEGLHAAAMHVQRVVVLVDVEAVADVHDSGVEPDPAGVIDQRVPIEHVVAVDPGGEQSGAEPQPAIDRSALAAVALADPLRQPGRVSS